ncbi:hypothetical protein SAMN02927903_01572 [Flavobacterium caeni]|uniref:Uncharacterized protein n=1 Tax=Flavobacterium caeni TaxID=490189 RepID=A0A1G5GGQ2_9FLAO|nr:hypothetical protein SAMN02927903_01572 [Flavobacterium caeni]
MTFLPGAAFTLEALRKSSEASVKKEILSERSEFISFSLQAGFLAEKVCRYAFLLLLRRGKSRPAAAKTSIKFPSSIPTKNCARDGSGILLRPQSRHFGTEAVKDTADSPPVAPTYTITKLSGSTVTCLPFTKTTSGVFPSILNFVSPSLTETFKTWLRKLILNE